MIANGTRVQLHLECLGFHDEVSGLPWPGLAMGKIVEAHATLADHWVIELDDGRQITCTPASFVVSTPHRTVVEPSDTLNDWHESPRPYDAALRIIADLHAAYGSDVGISVGRGAEDDIVTLHHPAVLGDAAMVDLTITFSVFGSARIEWNGGKFDTDLGPNAYTLGVLAARVWLHEHGAKR